MKINMKMEQKLDDSIRFEKIVKLLPEQKTRVFLDELWNGYYSKGFLEMLVKYKDYSKTILSEFKNKRLEKKRKAFNGSFQSLLYFLNTHFFPHLEKYVLYPESKGTPEWDKRFKELHIQIEDFKQKYEELIATGKTFLDKISSAPPKISKVEKRKKETKTILYLSLVGDLYRSLKNKILCYSMSESSDRHKILRYLIENKGYQLTSQISLNLEGKSKDSIRREINKMNQIIQGKLEIKDNIIKGRKGSGYRVNPKYKIIFKKE